MLEQVAKLGRVTWADLTVPDAERVRDFYRQVVGWEARGVSMGGYEDYSMVPAGEGDGKAAAGICHARGVNEGLPAQWLLYVAVENVGRAAERAERLGGKVVRRLGDKCCVIQDPAGAVLALIEPEVASDPD